MSAKAIHLRHPDASYLTACGSMVIGQWTSVVADYALATCKNCRRTTAVSPRPKVYRFTRDQLIDAIRNRKMPEAPGKGVFILEGDAVFEHMADSIIEALESS